MARSLTSSLPRFRYSNLLLLGVVGTAAGLNLAVMDLDSQSTNTEATASLVTVSDLLEVQQVVVDVPVPAGQPVDGEVIPSSAAQPAPDPQPQSVVVPAPLPPAVLPSTTPPATEPPSTTPTTVLPPTTLPTAAPPSTAPPATTSPPLTTVAPATTPEPTTEYLTYHFDGVADIVVAHHDRRILEFWSATPEEGWAFAVEKNSANVVEVKFRRVGGGEGEATFKVKREDGELEVKKER